MKRAILFSVVMAVVVAGFSQGIDVGLKAGLVFGTPYGVAESGASGSLGIGPSLGLTFRSALNEKWTLQCEIVYVAKGSTFKTPVSGDTIYEDHNTTPGEIIYWPTIYKGWVEGKFDNRYLDLPILFSLNAGKRWNLLFGPKISYLLKGYNKGTADIDVGDPASPFTTVTDEPFDQSHQINRWDYGGLAGAQFHISNRFYAGMNLTIGLRSIYKNNYKYIDRSVRNIYMETSVVFKLGNQ